LYIRVFDQRAPTAIALGDAGGAGKLGGAWRVAASERDDLATWVGAQCGELDGASVIGADNAKADHGLKPCKKYRF
jgi:hypothetical protein